MISCARVYWICHFNSWISHPRLCFIAIQMKFSYPVPTHFQFLGRDRSGTCKKSSGRVGYGDPVWPCLWSINLLFSEGNAESVNLVKKMSYSLNYSSFRFLFFPQISKQWIDIGSSHINFISSNTFISNIIITTANISQ